MISKKVKVKIRTEHIIYLNWQIFVKYNIIKKKKNNNNN